MRKFTDLIKTIAIIALIAILIGAVAKLFVPTEDIETPTPDESIVETLPDSSKPEDSKPDTSEPEESEPDVSEPEVSDEVYLDVVLHEDIENFQYLNVEQPDNYTVVLDGYTNYEGWHLKPFAFIVDLSDLYSKYGEGYYVLSYEIVHDENTTPYKFYIEADDNKLMSEEPSVFKLTQDNIQISFETFDPGVQDLVVKFKAMYVSQEYIETANLG